jgi:hypothetical protein
MEELLQHLYGCSDIARLPKPAVDAASIHPDCVRLDIFRFVGRLDPLRNSYTDMELSSSYQRIEAAVAKMREIITGK